jgi:hypothetical protein
MARTMLYDLLIGVRAELHEKIPLTMWNHMPFAVALGSSAGV